MGECRSYCNERGTKKKKKSCAALFNWHRVERVVPFMSVFQIVGLTFHSVCCEVGKERALTAVGRVQFNGDLRLYWRVYLFYTALFPVWSGLWRAETFLWNLEGYSVDTKVSKHVLTYPAHLCRLVCLTQSVLFIRVWIVRSVRPEEESLLRSNGDGEIFSVDSDSLISSTAQPAFSWSSSKCMLVLDSCKREV